MSAQNKSLNRPVETVGMIRPISNDFWLEFAVQFGWVVYFEQVGRRISAVEKTIQLASRVVAYSRIKHEELEEESLELIKNLPNLVMYLNWAFYSCIELPNRRIGLGHLRQISIFPTMDLQVGMICRGFTEPIPMDWYYTLRSAALEISYQAVNYVHAIFHSLMGIQRVRIPPGFPTGPELLIK